MRRTDHLAARQPRRRRVAASALAVLGILMPVAGCGLSGNGISTPSPLTVSSAVLGQHILPTRFTCYGDHGGKVNPPLDWSGATPQTRSVAVIMDDASAPITPYIYWIVFDINPATTDIQEDSMPQGAKTAVNSSGQAGYDPPCPQGRHSYRITVYALNSTVDLPDGASLPSVLKAIAAARIGMGRYGVTATP